MADNEDNLDALCDLLEESDDEDIFNLVEELPCIQFVASLKIALRSMIWF